MTSSSISGYRLSFRECGVALSPEMDVCDYAMTPNDCQDRSTLVMTHQAGNDHFEIATWDDFKSGFFDEQDDEFYIGNDALHYLSANGVTLRIDMWSTDGSYIAAEYSDVAVASESDDYVLTLGAYERGTATAGGLVTYHSGSPFSTQDDNNSGSNCTLEHPSAWWYLVNRDVSFPNNSVSRECFTSQLTSATDMTWALEDNDGVITGQLPINKVVMRLMGDTVSGEGDQAAEALTAEVVRRKTLKIHVHIAKFRHEISDVILFASAVM